ncbi:MAG: hypothetical protein LBV43_05850 [Prevotella sp.]|nr:hypothetical protein [Prevotella sp.]
MVENRFISLEPKGRGSQYTFTYKLPANSIFYFLTSRFDENQDNDSIRQDATDCEIQLEVYENNGIFLGMNDKPEQAYQSGGMYYNGALNKLGTHIASLSKRYYGQPLWFNLNSIKKAGYSTAFLSGEGWCDAGTMKNIRVMASRYSDGRKETFHLSDTLYQITGYGRTLEENDLSGYIFDTALQNTISPLTTQPQVFHIKGQSQYFNFILSDSQHETSYAKNELAVTYKLFTTSNRTITEVTDHKQKLNKFEMVNTIRLDIGRLIDEYPNVGYVEAYLSWRLETEPSQEEQYRIVSHPLRFQILSECLHKVNDFAFLNRLGGWSSFNFAGTEKTDFKASATTNYKTHTPDKLISSEIESVYNKSVTEQFSAETMPVTKEVCDWLKELSTSRAVYELSTKRYVIVDELNIKHDTKDELFRLEMKYHYSDAYNARIE